MSHPCNKRKKRNRKSATKWSRISEKEDEQKILSKQTKQIKRSA